MILSDEGQAMNMREYLKNRAASPLAELAKHRGEWSRGARTELGSWRRHGIPMRLTI